MRFSLYVRPDDLLQLELEQVPLDLKVHLTRLAEQRVGDHEDPARLPRQNRLVNRSRALRGLAPYVLESDEWGDYQPAEHVWHDGEFQLIFTRLETAEFVEFVCELVDEGLFTSDEINELLGVTGLSFRLTSDAATRKPLLRLSSVEELISEMTDRDSEVGHPNIRVLLQRMDDTLTNRDYAGTLHASACVFETMAKDVVAIPAVQDQTLASFFDRYRMDSMLPGEILDWILDCYKARNTTPLSGHGSTGVPAISREQAVTLAVMTKAFVSIEYELQAPAGSTH